MGGGGGGGGGGVCVGGGGGGGGVCIRRLELNIKRSIDPPHRRWLLGVLTVPGESNKVIFFTSSTTENPFPCFFAITCSNQPFAQSHSLSAAS